MAKYICIVFIFPLDLIPMSSLVFETSTRTVNSNGWMEAKLFSQTGKVENQTTKDKKIVLCTNTSTWQNMDGTTFIAVVSNNTSANTNLTSWLTPEVRPKDFLFCRSEGYNIDDYF